MKRAFRGLGLAEREHRFSRISYRQTDYCGTRSPFSRISYRQTDCRGTRLQFFPDLVPPNRLPRNEIIVFAESRTAKPTTAEREHHFSRISYRQTNHQLISRVKIKKTFGGGR